MAFDEELTLRMRTALGERPDISEKRMMGGICFFLKGNMVSGADRSKEGERRFMFRVGRGNEAASGLPRGEPMILGNRPMGGFYFVDGDRCDDDLLRRWLELALCACAEPAAQVTPLSRDANRCLGQIENQPWSASNPCSRKPPVGSAHKAGRSGVKPTLP